MTGLTGLTGLTGITGLTGMTKLTGMTRLTGLTGLTDYLCNSTMLPKRETTTTQQKQYSEGYALKKRHSLKNCLCGITWPPVYV